MLNSPIARWNNPFASGEAVSELRRMRVLGREAVVDGDHRYVGAERAIESDRRLIPVEHRPFEAGPALRDAALREMDEQRTADAAAAKGGPDVQVLEIDAVAAAERGEIREPHRKPGRCGVPFGDVAENARVFAEQRGLDHGLGGVDRSEHALVFGEFAHEGENESGLAGPYRPNGNGHGNRAAGLAHGPAKPVPVCTQRI